MNPITVALLVASCFVIIGIITFVVVSIFTAWITPPDVDGDGECVGQ